ncbi:MAG: ATP synthase F1 subunit epsilon [Bacteroidetes bacterium]|nr:ATP synthase F1 subunit epsilon [Bacteroidota bacterium]
MHLDILTPDEKLYDGAADSVTVPGSDGVMQILNNHAALISSLAKGDVKVLTPEGEKIFKIAGGVVEVVNNKVIVLAE